jgi:hypothetical protein
MNRPRYLSWLLGVAVLSLLAAKPMTAISPTAIMVYGEGLKTRFFSSRQAQPSSAPSGCSGGGLAGSTSPIACRAIFC